MTKKVKSQNKIKEKMSASEQDIRPYQLSEYKSLMNTCYHVWTQTKHNKQFCIHSPSGLLYFGELVHILRAESIS